MLTTIGVDTDKYVNLLLESCIADIIINWGKHQNTGRLFTINIYTQLNCTFCKDAKQINDLIMIVIHNNPEVASYIHNVDFSHGELILYRKIPRFFF